MSRWKVFAPVLVGAQLSDRVRACAGAAAALVLVGIVGAVVHGDGPALPWIAGPIGASAVLVFAVPASPMAQPWPVIGGNALSALTGVAVGHWVGHGALGAGVASGAAIMVMSLTRSLHPPGGAAALTGALGGGWLFALAPVALNAIILVALGWLFHRALTGHAYPHHAPAATPGPELVIHAEDVDHVLSELDEPLDVSRDDVLDLVRRVTARSLVRDGAG